MYRQRRAHKLILIAILGIIIATSSYRCRQSISALVRGYSPVRNNRQLFSDTNGGLPAWEPDYSRHKGSFSHISADQWERLEELSRRLYDWNSKVNLVSRKDIDSLLPNHIVPCLSISLVRRFGEGESVIDVGTGGGLPGLPMAIINPDAKFTLLDSNSKKMMVVKDIAESLGLKNVRVICDRAEKVNESFDFMMGRAVSALPNFLSFSSHFVTGKSKSVPVQGAAGVEIGSGLLYIKGGDFTEELKEAKIKQHQLFPVSELVKTISSDKFVLYLPAKEIVDFRKRMQQSTK